MDDSSTTPHNTPVDIDVLDNDTDPDGDPLLVTGFTQPSNGTVDRNPDDTLKYVPNTGFIGVDPFTYTVGDGLGGTGTATVRVDVQPPPLVAVDDSATTAAGQPVDIDVLANDSGDSLSVTDVTDPANGTAEILSGTAIRYVPALGFIGPDMFDYTVTDVNGLTGTATVNVTVEPPPLIATGDQRETFAGEPIVIDVLTNDQGDG